MKTTEHELALLIDSRGLNVFQYTTEVNLFPGKQTKNKPTHFFNRLLIGQTIGWWPLIST